MKRLYRIGVFLVVSIVIGMLILYYLDKFTRTVRDIGRKPQVNGTEEDLPPIQIPPDIMPSPGIYPNLAGSAEVFSGEELLRKETLYVIEEYDRNTGNSVKTTAFLPEQYVGMNRKELEEALQRYQESPTHSDLQKGLKKVSLLRYSSEYVVVRKSYYLAPAPKPERYCLVDEGGYVVVRCEGTDEFFCETGIEIQTLPFRLQEEIKEGKLIRTQEELYAFLESYSS